MEVIKLNVRGEETWRYRGRILQERPGEIIIEAFFDRRDMDVNGLFLGRGDRFVEHYYRDRWYNIFEVHARVDDQLRGWYCNITRPADWQAGRLTYIDLALDLVVFPDGRQEVLDRDEFAALDVSAETRSQALEALVSLQSRFRKQIKPE